MPEPMNNAVFPPEPDSSKDAVMSISTVDVEDSTDCTPESLKINCCDPVLEPDT